MACGSDLHATLLLNEHPGVLRRIPQSFRLYERSCSFRTDQMFRASENASHGRICSRESSCSHVVQGRCCRVVTTHRKGSQNKSVCQSELFNPKPKQQSPNKSSFAALYLQRTSKDRSSFPACSPGTATPGYSNSGLQDAYVSSLSEP